MGAPQGGLAPALRRDERVRRRLPGCPGVRPDQGPQGWLGVPRSCPNPGHLPGTGETAAEEADDQQHQRTLQGGAAGIGRQAIPRPSWALKPTAETDAKMMFTVRAGKPRAKFPARLARGISRLVPGSPITA